MLLEPVTSLTDVLLTVIASGIAWNLYRNAPRPLTRRDAFWVNSFAALTERARRLNARLREREAALGIAMLPSDSLLLLARLLYEEGLDMAEHLFGPHPAAPELGLCPKWRRRPKYHGKKCKGIRVHAE